MKLRLSLILLSLSYLISATGLGQPSAATRPGGEPPLSYSKWKNGPASDESYFPIAVWLQSPRNAAKYKAAGINLYVGLWRGPTTEQLAELKAAGVKLICAQNRVGLENRDNPVIIGWMHGDEPDNAQSLGTGKGYGPPILPEKIVRDYERLAAADPTRPILLNLGQGVAWDNYIGRGVRRNHPEDYPQYIKGCDIASFDIYPAVHDAREIAGKLEFVGSGVERLMGWSQGEKIVWNCIECTHISNRKTKATPEQVRSEVWMSLIKGSRGLIYFVHQFQPTFDEAALLNDPEMLAAVTGINQQIRDLAPVLNSPSVPEIVKVTAVPPSDAVIGSNQSAQGLTPVIASLIKRRNGTVYAFTVNMSNRAVSGSFRLDDATAKAARGEVAVLNEHRSIRIERGGFADEYKPYAVHLYAFER